jgi:hypothetical protein
VDLPIGKLLNTALKGCNITKKAMTKNIPTLFERAGHEVAAMPKWVRGEKGGLFTSGL